MHDKKKRAEVSVKIAHLDKLVAEHTNNTAQIAKKVFSEAAKVFNFALDHIKQTKGTLATAIIKCADTTVSAEFAHEALVKAQNATATAKQKLSENPTNKTLDEKVSDATDKEGEAE